MRGIQNAVTKTLVASAARTATGNSGALEYPNDVSNSLFVLNITAASGTSPTLDLAIQITPDDGTTWFTVERFAQQTAAATLGLAVHHKPRVPYFIQPSVVVGSGTNLQEFTIADTGGVFVHHVPFSRKIRILWTIGGTNPSFTFTVSQFSARWWESAE